MNPRPPVSYVLRFEKEAPTPEDEMLGRQYFPVAYKQILTTDRMYLNAGVSLWTLRRLYGPHGEICIDTFVSNTLRVAQIFVAMSKVSEEETEDDFFISGVIIRPEIYSFGFPNPIPEWAKKHNFAVMGFVPTHDSAISDRPDLYTLIGAVPPKSDAFQGFIRPPQLTVKPSVNVAPEPLIPQAEIDLLDKLRPIALKQPTIVAASAVPATRFSGLLAVAVQAIYGIGVVKLFPVEKDVLGIDQVPEDADDDYYDYNMGEIRPNGVRVFYDWKFEKTHGIIRDQKGGPWLIEVSKDRGVLAMKCPCFPIKNPDGDKLEDLMNIVGGFPTGQSFPDSVTSWISSGKVIELLKPEFLREFYEKNPYNENCGWAFSPTEPKAVNTCYEGTATSIDAAYMYELTFDIDKKTAKITEIQNKPIYGFETQVTLAVESANPGPFSYEPPRGQRLEVYFVDEKPKSLDTARTIYAADSLKINTKHNQSVTWDVQAAATEALPVKNLSSEESVDAIIYAFFDRAGNRVDVIHYDALNQYAIADLSVQPMRSDVELQVSGSPYVKDTIYKWVGEVHDQRLAAPFENFYNRFAVSLSISQQDVSRFTGGRLRSNRLVGKHGIRRGAYVKCNEKAGWGYQFDVRTPPELPMYGFVSVDCSYAVIPAKCREAVEFGFLLSTVSAEAPLISEIPDWPWGNAGGVLSASDAERAQAEKVNTTVELPNHLSRSPVNSYRFLLAPLTHADLNSAPKGVTVWPHPIYHTGVKNEQDLFRTAAYFPPAPLTTVKFGGFAASYSTFGTRNDYKQRQPGEDAGRDSSFSRIRAAGPFSFNQFMHVPYFKDNSAEAMRPQEKTITDKRAGYLCLVRDWPDMAKNLKSQISFDDAGYGFNNICSFVGYC